MKANIFLYPLIYLIFFIQPVSAQDSDFLVDERDGNIYLVAKFNDLWWMCQNLKYDIDGSGCYNNDETNCFLSGRLYNWEAARKACPEGYHLPTDDEWKNLESYIGMEDDDLDKNFNRSSGTVGKYLKIDGGLKFDADYVGMISMNGISTYEGSGAYFWTASENGDKYSWVRIIQKEKEGVDRQSLEKRYKLTVRCVKPADPDEAQTESLEQESPQ